MEPVKPGKMEIYQSNPYRIYLSWLHFDNELRVQEGPKVLHICFCSLSNIFKWQLGAPALDIEQPQEKKLYRNNIRAPNQFRRESQPQYLKK